MAGGRDARLIGMVNVSELLINTVSRTELSAVIRLKPKWYVVGFTLYIWVNADIEPPVDRQNLNQLCETIGTR